MPCIRTVCRLMRQTTCCGLLDWGLDDEDDNDNDDDLEPLKAKVEKGSISSICFFVVVIVVVVVVVVVGGPSHSLGVYLYNSISPYIYPYIIVYNPYPTHSPPCLAEGKDIKRRALLGLVVGFRVLGVG